MCFILQMRWRRATGNFSYFQQKTYFFLNYVVLRLFFFPFFAHLAHLLRFLCATSFHRLYVQLLLKNYCAYYPRFLIATTPYHFQVQYTWRVWNKNAPSFYLTFCKRFIIYIGAGALRKLGNRGKIPLLIVTLSIIYYLTRNFPCSFSQNIRKKT